MGQKNSHIPSTTAEQEPLNPQATTAQESISDIPSVDTFTEQKAPHIDVIELAAGSGSSGNALPPTGPEEGMRAPEEIKPPQIQEQQKPNQTISSSAKQPNSNGCNCCNTSVSIWCCCKPNLNKVYEPVPVTETPPVPSSPK